MTPNITQLDGHNNRYCHLSSQPTELLQENVIVEALSNSQIDFCHLLLTKASHWLMKIVVNNNNMKLNINQLDSLNNRNCHLSSQPTELWQENVIVEALSYSPIVFCHLLLTKATNWF
jgi:hypothetical protein